MKKLIAVAAAMLMAFTMFAQSGESIYRKYSGKPGVQAVYISPAMFRMMGSLPLDEMADGAALAPLVRSMSGFYLVNVVESALGKELDADVQRFLSSKKFELLMEVSDEGQKMKMMSISEGDYVKSFVMVSHQDCETVFICLDGDILRSDLDNFIASSME